MKRIVTVGALTLLLLASSVVTPAAAAEIPFCNNVQQPVLAKTEVSAAGATFTWLPTSWAAEYYYVEWRVVNGQTVQIGGTGSLGRGTTVFLPWTKDGYTTTAIAAGAIGWPCRGSATPTVGRAYYADVQASAPAPPAITVPASPTKPQKRVECKNRKTKEIKVFALWRCPKGWVRIN